MSILYTHIHFYFCLSLSKNLFSLSNILTAMATLPHFLLTGQTSSSTSQPPQTPSPPTTTTTTKTKNKHHRNKKASTKTSKPPNKPRQRGMGVEQLERMRLQGLKETNGSGGGAGGSNVILPKITQSSFSQQQRVNQVENYGIPVYNGSTGLMMMAGNGLGCRVTVDPGKGNGVVQGIMELPSIPNMMAGNGLGCDLCYKKKRTKEEKKLGFNDLGLNLDFNMNINGLMGNKKNMEEEVEVVAVHRRNQYTGNMVMEYEFFPGKQTVVGSSSKELGLSIDHHHHHQASSSSSAVDLSLKLSF